MSIATHIMLATDFSDATEAAVEKAGELARSLNARLTVLRVHGHPPEPPEAVVPPDRLVWSSDLDDEAEQGLRLLQQNSFADIEQVTLAVAEDGTPYHAISDYAANHGVDLIVMGSHRRTGLAHIFFGSVAEKVVRHAGCPVLVVPPEIDGSPEDAIPASSRIHQPL